MISQNNSSKSNGFIPYTGIDALEIFRIERAVTRWGQRFLDRVYTGAEQSYCRGQTQRFAGRFAAKEAISKLLGTGIGYVRWKDIEILPNTQGKPIVALYGVAAKRAAHLNLGAIDISITHTHTLALAFAVAVAALQE